MDLSRNVMFLADGNVTHGYTLFTGTASVDIRYAGFCGLGRTTMSDLDNTTFDANGNVTHIGTNQIGRYPMYFQNLTGPANTPADGYTFTLIGDSVLGDDDGASIDRKWGIALNNTSNGLVDGNTVFDTPGAGILTETGSETGNLIENNMVAWVQGLGARNDYYTPATGIAREGSAYWFAGTDNSIVNNVATDVVSPGWSYGFTYYIVNPAAYSDIPIREFSGNEAYGPINTALSYWYIGMAGNTEEPIGTSVIENFQAWNYYKLGIFNYPCKNVVFDHLVLLENQSISSGQNNYGFYGGDYQAENLVIQNSDIEGASNGILPSVNAKGTPQTIENTFLANYHDIQMLTLISSGDVTQIGSRTVILKNDMFDIADIPVSPYEDVAPTAIWMDYTVGPGESLVQQDQVLVYDYNQVAGDDFQVYYLQQAADFVVPQSSMYPNGISPMIIGAPVAGLTNAETWSMYGIAIAGAVAPSTSTQRSDIVGLIEPI